MVILSVEDIDMIMESVGTIPVDNNKEKICKEKMDILDFL